jgi:hypothetical protein
MWWLRPNHKVKGIPYWLSATAYSICSLYMGGRSSIRNLRTRHAIVTGTHLLPSFHYVRSYKYNITGQMYTLIWHHKMAQLCSLTYVTKVNCSWWDETSVHYYLVGFERSEQEDVLYRLIPISASSQLSRAGHMGTVFEKRTSYIVCFFIYLCQSWWFVK